MPRYFCDYCETYLTHDSASVRKQHNAGYKHKANVRAYYQQFEEQQTQDFIDQKVKEHLGQAAAYQRQFGASYHHHVSVPQYQPHAFPVLHSAHPSTNPALSNPIRPPVLSPPNLGTSGQYGASSGMASSYGPPAVPISSESLVSNPGVPGLSSITPPSSGMSSSSVYGWSSTCYTSAPYQSQQPNVFPTNGGYNGVYSYAAPPSVAAPPNHAYPPPVSAPQGNSTNGQAFPIPGNQSYPDDEASPPGTC